MAGTKELKARIESAREIQKITNAMHLIATTKLRRAKQELAATRPYFDAVRNDTARVFQHAPKEGNPYISSAECETQGPWACLVICSDKGMAGAYNKNVLREAQRAFSQRPGCRLFLLGQNGVNFLRYLGHTPEKVLTWPSSGPFTRLAGELGNELADGYDSGKWREIQIIYTDMKNSLQVDVCRVRLLPFELPEKATETAEFEFHPSAEEVLRSAVRSYVSGFIYGAMVDSYCSEQNSRMTAMDTATENAQRLLDDLSLEYNRMRQSIITQEITEISAGAKALKHAEENDEEEGASL